MSQKTFEVITNQILRKLEEGVVPWHRPWSSPAGIPKNLVTKREYRGCNFFILSIAGFASPYWLTFRQAVKMGGHIKKGEKGTPVVFWKWMNIKEDDQGEGDGEAIEKSIPLVRYYSVFNLAQCEGIEAPKEETPSFEWDPIERCEAVVRNMKNPPVISLGMRACYSPSLDTICMPNRELFEKREEYYATIFHELTHSTGHSSRLNRPTIIDICPFGSTNYSREELIAEMGAAFLCAHTGIENKTIDNSAGYIANWLTKLKNDPKLVIIASGQAQKASDCVLGKAEPEEEE